jgi:hypothetical protein
MDIVIPCAGKSSRFPNMRPKYLLTDYSGKLMIQRSIEKLLVKNSIHIAILKEHDEKYDSFQILRDVFSDNVNIIILESPTRGPAETVFKCLQNTEICGDFLVKDCDSFFDFELESGNIVYTSKIKDNPNLTNISQLGFVVSNEQNLITSLVEKQIVSDSFCVGGYQFSSKQKFIEAFNALINDTKELYISNVIDYLILNNEIFVEREVKNYINVGTSKEWFDFNNKPTIFCDIDGVLIENQAPFGNKKYGTNFSALPKNVNVLKKYLKNDSLIIFTTARPDKYFNVTRNVLNELGFETCPLIMGLNHSKRILINDYDHSNPYPTSISINLKRNGDNLDEFL